MKLYCVRHGHAEKSATQNGERPLTSQGVDEVSRVANYLAHRGVHVSHVMHSTKLRARQSADILSKAMTTGLVTENCDLLEPDRSVAPFVEMIQSWDDDTMIVGHMPFVSHLVSALILGDDAYSIVCFPPGTMVCLERYEDHHWILNWVLRPDLVPDDLV